MSVFDFKARFKDTRERFAGAVFWKKSRTALIFFVEKPISIQQKYSKLIKIDNFGIYAYRNVKSSQIDDTFSFSRLQCKIFRESSCQTTTF